MQCAGLKVQGAGLRVEGAGLRVEGAGLRVESGGCTSLPASPSLSGFDAAVYARCRPGKKESLS